MALYEVVKQAKVIDDGKVVMLRNVGAVIDLGPEQLSAFGDAVRPLGTTEDAAPTEQPDSEQPGEQPPNEQSSKQSGEQPGEQQPNPDAPSEPVPDPTPEERRERRNRGRSSDAG